MADSIEIKIKQDTAVLNNKTPGGAYEAAKRAVQNNLSEAQTALNTWNLTPDQKKVYKDYIVAVSGLQDLNEENRQQLNQLKQQIEKENLGVVTPPDVQTTFDTELKTQLKPLDDGLETMNSEKLEKELSLAESILNPAWIDRISVLKEKIQEIHQLEPTLQGTVGAVLIKKLQEKGYSFYFTWNKQIKVVSNQTDAQPVETRINAHLAWSPALIKSLQTGLLYTSPSFQQYRDAQTDVDGKIIDPAHVDIQTYIKYLWDKKKNLKTPLDSTEKAFLHSSAFYDTSIDFQKTLLQSQDYAKVVGIMAQVTGDQSINTLNPTPPSVPGSSPSESTASDPNTAAWAVGKGIGQIGGLLGKLAGAGASGGMRVLGEVFSEATKSGWSWWVLAVIGGLFWSIFSEKGLGFWGTLGAIFGVGVADAAAKGELGKLPIWKNKPETKGAPSSETPPPAAGVTVSSTVDTGAPANAKSLPGTPSENTDWNTNLLSLPSLTLYRDTNDIITNVLEPVGGVNFVALQKALAQKQGTNEHKNAWNAVRESINYSKMSDDEKRRFDGIVQDQQNVNIINAYVQVLAKNPFVQAFQKDDSQGFSLLSLKGISKRSLEKSSVSQGTIPVENATGNPIPPNIPTPDRIITENEAYGNLVVIARMVEYGYLPKINYTAGEVASKEGKIPRLLKGAIYLGLGGPLTNNEPWKSWFSGEYRHYQDDFMKWLSDKVKTERAELNAHAQDPDFSWLEKEVNARREALFDLEVAIKNWDAQEIKDALSKYRNIAKTPFWKWKIGGIDSFYKKERQRFIEIDNINAKIEENYRSMKTALDVANVEWASEETKKAAKAAVEKYNTNLVELETAGVRDLSALPPAERVKLAETNPWVAKMTAENGGIDKFNNKLSEFSGKGIGKWIVWVWLIWLLWDSKWSLMELWNKGDYTTLTKRGWDLAAGATPVVWTLHETAILSNFWGYRDMVLGKGYQMSGLEEGFRVVGAIPFVWAGVKVAGKVGLKVGESFGIATAKTTGRAIMWASDIAVVSAQKLWQVGTYAVLWYSAAIFTFDLSKRLTNKIPTSSK